MLIFAAKIINIFNTISMKSLFILLFALNLSVLRVSAQFYTITADTAMMYERETEAVSESVPVMMDSVSKEQEDIGGKEPVFDVFVDVRDSMLLELLHERLSVCLPLDFLKVNSRYGYRTDPVYRCTRFHDGIDLACRYEKVYSMLPAVVKAVRFGNRGYGNHVVLEHGGIECLYGHLNTILVREGDVIPAGAVVGISGNTGKSTGPHLHLQIRVNGKSVDPKPFVDALNGYIIRLQERIRYLRFGKKPSLNQHIGNLVEVMEKHDALHPHIVIAQSLLE